MGFYRNYILPRMLSKIMAAPSKEQIRPQVITEARGVVLELGVGPGYNLPLYRGIQKLYALEPSLALANEAQGRAQNVSFPVEFLNARAEHIPLPDRSVDTVVSTWTLCSVSDPEQVLDEIKRVLKPGGSFVFVDHGVSPRPVPAFFQRIFNPFSVRFSGGCHLNRDIAALLHAAGFTIDPMHQSHEAGHPLIFNTQGVAVE